MLPYLIHKRRKWIDERHDFIHNPVINFSGVCQQISRVGQLFCPSVPHCMQFQFLRNQKGYQMKKISLICLFCIIGLYTNKVTAESNRGIQPTETSKGDKKITAFIRFWGLIKYRHPAAIKGLFDADRIFLENIGKVNTQSSVALNEDLLRMVADLDQKNQGDKTLQPAAQTSLNAGHSTSDLPAADQLRKNIRQNWIADSIYSSTVKTILLRLSAQKNTTGQHFYIPSLHYEAELPHENTYADYGFGQENMNLLALAKAWNAVEYLFPYKYVIGKDWGKVLEEMIPVFREITDRTSYEKAILRLEVAINDTHAGGFMNQMKNKTAVLNLKSYPPFDYQVFNDQLLIRSFLSDSLENGSMLKKGDLISNIDGISVKQLLRNRYPLIPASNKAVKDRTLSTGDAGSAYFFSDFGSLPLPVTVIRKGKKLGLTLNMLDSKNKSDMTVIRTYFLNRYSKEQQISGYEDPDAETGLFRAWYFSDRHLPEGDAEIAAFAAKLKAKRTLIFDMRGYPASPGLFYTYLPRALGIAAFRFAKYYAADLSDPGAFYYRPEIETYLSATLKAGAAPYQGKIIILTDEHTQSMGEWFTMMLSQLNNHTVILGSQTAGADGDLKKIMLPGGYHFVFSGNGIFYPDGRETQRVGIRPDITYRPAAGDLVKGTDDLLEKAMQLGKK